MPKPKCMHAEVEAEKSAKESVKKAKKDQCMSAVQSAAQIEHQSRQQQEQDDAQANHPPEMPSQKVPRAKAKKKDIQAVQSVNLNSSSRNSDLDIEMDDGTELESNDRNLEEFEVVPSTKKKKTQLHDDVATARLLLLKPTSGNSTKGMTVLDNTTMTKGKKVTKIGGLRNSSLGVASPASKTMWPGAAGFSGTHSRSVSMLSVSSDGMIAEDEQDEPEEIDGISDDEGEKGERAALTNDVKPVRYFGAGTDKPKIHSLTIVAPNTHTPGLVPLNTSDGQKRRLKKSEISLKDLHPIYLNGFRVSYTPALRELCGTLAPWETPSEADIY
ncbi:hypothetical protein PAXRUDRAFT_16224 [Paxillus rubicundulus Ve08.2h10]|uniref:Uncharacterized protein n=1 Tax=Paxillus rubicundulus Ve08.2h10 TaxID=930991 RepID=A0A0D0DF67_9AGAM|nr:hypothetical protein PAXRUDRAFT_16224 [Paxillus rubicundulus Ve08.2h10]